MGGGALALAVARKRTDDAARLLGCAQQVHESIGLQLEPFEQAVHDETLLSTIDLPSGENAGNTFARFVT